MLNNIKQSLLLSLEVRESLPESERSSDDEWATNVMNCYSVKKCSFDDEEDNLHSVLSDLARKFRNKTACAGIEVAAYWLNQACKEVI